MNYGPNFELILHGISTFVRIPGNTRHVLICKKRKRKRKRKRRGRREEGGGKSKEKSL